jgi:trimeric autotransporter adhesin
MFTIRFTARQWFVLVLLFAVAAPLLMLVDSASAQGPRGGPKKPADLAGTAFTYQGQLKQNGALLTSTCNFTFTLYADSGGTTPVGSPASIGGTGVINGLFTVQLNGSGEFGAAAFNGDARWLKTVVQCTGDGRATTLGPLQRLTPAPIAFALPGLYTQQNTTSPNVIGGHISNTVSVGVVGATIGGGGLSVLKNSVTADVGTIGGGDNNTVGGAAATIGGGENNTANGHHSTIGGGNLDAASGIFATIGGGYGNTASGKGAFIGGGGTDGTLFLGNVASGNASTIGGGISNTIGINAIYATIGGGYSNTVKSPYATIGGGKDNTITSTTSYATIGGGQQNIVSGDWATIGGGYSNTVKSLYATIGGGAINTASGIAATIGGGNFNTASEDYATVSGGYFSIANRFYATVGGGYNNFARGDWAAVGGGRSNDARGDWATVGGGEQNTASGIEATVPGGYLNSAGGDYSFAAGTQANANHTGTFVWGDNTFTNINSTANNQFLVRASGGITMYTNSIATIGVTLQPGSGTWSSFSDRAMKANFASVNGRDVLVRLAAVPIQTWNYTTQHASIRHIGPMAQDFHAAFSVGEDDKHITTVDADGVALAAIQGLYQVVQEREAEISGLKSQVASQRKQIEAMQSQNTALDARLTALEHSPLTKGGEGGYGALALIVGAVGVIAVERGRKRGVG